MIELHDPDGNVIYVSKSSIDMILPPIAFPRAGAIVQVTGVKQGVRETVAQVKQLYDKY